MTQKSLGRDGKSQRMQHAGGWVESWVIPGRPVSRRPARVWAVSASPAFSVAASGVSAVMGTRSVTVLSLPPSAFQFLKCRVC